MLETKKIALCYQCKSCLCRGWNVRNWLCGTKANCVCTTDKMLEVSFVVLSQIMFVSQMECQKLALWNQAKLCLCRMQNVRNWLCGTKPIHVCSADGILKNGFEVPSQITFVSRMECSKLVLRTKPNHVCVMDQMLDGGFVAKACSLKPGPSLLYPKAQACDMPQPQQGEFEINKDSYGRRCQTKFGLNEPNEK